MAMLRCPFSPGSLGSKSTLLPNSQPSLAISGHLCKSLPTPFNSLALEATFQHHPSLISYREPDLAVPTAGRNVSGFVMQTVLPGV